MDQAAIDIAKALVRLSELTIFELRGEWRRFHRTPPPMRLSRDLLTRGITYKLQERAYVTPRHSRTSRVPGFSEIGCVGLAAPRLSGSGPRFFGLRQRQLNSCSSARAGHGEG